MINLKFNIAKCKNKNRDKTIRYFPQSSQSDIRKTLFMEAENYVRKTYDVPPFVVCQTYWTEDGRAAVLKLDTPKKRREWSRAMHAAYNGDESKQKEVRKKYGFIPRPINVLKKYVDYGYMKSQDVEHVYHCEPVDWKISDNLEDFESAYNVRFDDKDILVPNFNGYSCMSEEPDVGAFYYYFGAYMLIFYKKGTNEIVGRAVLWKWEDQLYVYKGYVKTTHQVAAAKVVEDMVSCGTLKRGLPSDFYTELQRMPNATPTDIYNEVGDTIRVPYIDEDLWLDESKTSLDFKNRCFGTKSTSVLTLWDYGIYHCDECGDEIREDDIIEVGDCIFCEHCAHRCEDCGEWFEPDADGDYVGDDWICDDCLGNYHYCECCNKYFTDDDIITYYDKNGYEKEVCVDCAPDVCRKCDDCDSYYELDALTEVGNKCYCDDCLEEQNQKE